MRPSRRRVSRAHHAAPPFLPTAGGGRRAGVSGRHGFQHPPPTHPPVRQLDNRWPLVFTIAAAADVVGNVWAPAAPQSAPPPPSSTPVTGRRLNGLSILCAFPISGSRTGAVLPSRPSFFAPLTFPHLHRATRGHGRRLFKRWGRSAHARRRVCTAARLGAAAADVVAKGWTERQDLCTPSSAPTRRGRKPPLSRRRHRAPVDVVCLPPAPARRRRGVSQRSY